MPQLTAQLKGVGTMALYDTENAIYEANKASWLRDHEGHWVIIKNDQVLGFYPSKQEAFTAAISKYGNTTFLAQRVQAEEEVISMPLLVPGEYHESDYPANR
ncbi:MAG TPA: hypothetical protein VGO93_19015 [Candidatus Xenobia bacterium]